jgi:hypothetical protein
LESIDQEHHRQEYMSFLVGWIASTDRLDALKLFLKQAGRTIHHSEHRARICLALAARLHDESSFGDHDDAMLSKGLVDLLPEQGAGIAAIVPKLLTLALARQESPEAIAGMNPAQAVLHQALIAKLAGYLPQLSPNRQETAFFRLFDNFASTAFEHKDAGALFIQRLARSAAQLHDPGLRHRATYRMLLHACELDEASCARLLVWMAKGLAANHDAAEQRQKMFMLAAAAARLGTVPRQRMLFIFQCMLLGHEDEAAQAVWPAINLVLAPSEVESPNQVEDIGG